MKMIFVLAMILFAGCASPTRYEGFGALASLGESSARNGYIVYDSEEDVQIFISRMNISLGLPRVINGVTKSVYAEPIQLNEFNEEGIPTPTGQYAVRIVKSVWGLLTEDEQSVVVDEPFSE